MNEVPGPPPTGAHPDGPPIPAAKAPRRHRKKVRREVEEGLMLLEHAARLQLRNRIVVDVLTSDGAVEVDAWRRGAREALHRLQGQAEATWHQLTAQIDRARSLPGRGGDEHDYRLRDLDNLLRRRRIARSTAKRVRAWAADPARIESLLERARSDAWEEVRRAMEGVVRGSADEAGDEGALQERLDLIRTVDLPALSRARTPPARRLP